MAWFDLSGEKIVAIGGKPAPSDRRMPPRIPLETVSGISSEKYAEQVLSRLGQERAAEIAGPLAAAELVSVDSEN